MTDPRAARPDHLERAYNYEHFRFRLDAMDRLDGVRVGEPAPDFVVSGLDGTPVRLSDYRGHPVVLETGSVTCPMYVGGVEQMNALVDRFPDVVFLVLYTREAHPGERVGPHRTMEQKTACARRLITSDGERRTILVDDLRGTAHQEYGSKPNTVHVIASDGTVVYRAMWNDPEATEAALLRVRDGADPGPMPAGFRPVALRTAVRVFGRGGRRALLDAIRAFPRVAWLRLTSAKRETDYRLS